MSIFHGKKRGPVTGNVVQRGEMNFNERKLMLTAHTGSISRVKPRKSNRLLTTLLVTAVVVIFMMVIAATAHGQALCDATCEPSQGVGDAPALVLVYLPNVRKP